MILSKDKLWFATGICVCLLLPCIGFAQNEAVLIKRPAREFRRWTWAASLHWPVRYPG